MRKTDLVFGTFLFIVSAYFFYESLLMHQDILPSTSKGAYTSPGVLPGVVSVIIMVLSLSLVISAWRSGARVKKIDLLNTIRVLKEKQSLRIILISFIFVIYIFGLIGNIPFYWATFIYIFVFMFLFQAGRFISMVLTAGVTSYLITYIFGTLINIPLP